MKNIISILILASAVSGSAMASCPQIEGKYTYSCTVMKDDSADFADVLDVQGNMVVNQTGCESYTFTNPKSAITEEFKLTDIVTNVGRSATKIRKSDSNVIKFKTVEHTRTDLGLESWTAWVTKGTIRAKKNGFVLKGKERSRVLGIFGSRHAKFDCRFVKEN